MQGTEHFDLAATVDAIWGAVVALVCRVGFDAAVHGLVIGLIIAGIGVFLLNRKHRYGKPLMAVSRKIAIFCCVLGLPGLIALVSSGKLPPVNNLVLSSVGLLGFWALVTLHLCMEEMNFQYFQQDTAQEG
ncbi:MAG: hypothetical protein K2X77_30905 [Candidatus Obscuribacterales bacterium]|jgi:hypothetical protein|nr:hypothetical protein [Candidatus Obscuribacterales bacterium]